VVRGLVGLIFGASCLAILARLDLASAGKSLAAAQVLPLLLACLANLLYLAMRGLRWGLLIQSLRAHFSLVEASRVSSLGIFLGAIYPGMGEAARLVLLRRRSLSNGEAAYAIAAERFLDLITLSMALGLGLVLAPLPWLPADNSVLAGVLGAAVVAALLAAVAGLTWRRQRGRVFGWVQPRWLEDLLRSAARPVMASWRELIARPLLGTGIVVTSLAIQVLTVATSWLALAAVEPAIPPALALLFVIAVNLGLGVLPAPMGVGLYQAAGLVVFSGVARSPETSIAAATMVQIVNYGAAALAATIAVLPDLRPGALRPVPRS
jgi:uncharacterized protein (TIRG00374 family)